LLRHLHRFCENAGNSRCDFSNTSCYTLVYAIKSMFRFVLFLFFFGSRKVFDYSVKWPRNLRNRIKTSWNNIWNKSFYSFANSSNKLFRSFKQTFPWFIEKFKDTSAHLINKVQWVANHVWRPK
jgi:hypothetical protein